MKIYENYPFDKHYPESYKPLKEEPTVLQLWNKRNLLDKIRRDRHNTNDGTFSIHWGPPFPTGSPHGGQVLNAVIKDAITRYCYQRKFEVITQFGWDCHGLSVEHEVEKKLAIKSVNDVKAMGISEFNEQCRQFVERNQAEWKDIFERVGVWVDFESVYSTMDMEYMESVWKVFKQLFDKGLVYRVTKVLPHSTACFSHLSNFEAEQNWTETNEKEFLIAVDFTEVGEKLLICTTAPWTLVDSPMICINPSSTYAKVKLGDGDQVYIVSRDRAEQIFNQNYTVVETIQGRHLLQLHYRPILPYGSNNLEEYPIIENGSIETDDGTGIVALSPYFNEDHYSACLKLGLALPEDACPIDESGRFKETIPQLCNLSTSEADEVILKCLQEQNRVVQLKDVKMKKPYCWRSDVPLINRVASSWFIPVKQLSSKLAEKKSQLNWVDGEPNNDLSILIEKSIDWPIGRKKFWGTPIPIWSSPSGDEIRCIGSIDELLQLSGKTSIPDLHREHLEYIKIPSSIPGNPPLRRITDVFDCWFESAVMPFISNRTQADLIIEGLDQSCGWFYTTLVLSAALDQSPPSKNILSHCLIKSADGLKLSKRKHNHNDALRLLDKYGADHLRIGLMAYPLETADSYLFNSDEAREISENLIHSAYEIFKMIIPRFGKKSWVQYGIISSPQYITSTFDLWLLTRMESTMIFYNSELQAYCFHNVFKRISDLIKDIQIWYPIRKVPRGKLNNFPTLELFGVFYRICTMLAPFAPFFIENMFQVMQPYVHPRSDFFQERLLPNDSSELINVEVETKMTHWQTVLEMVSVLRARHLIPCQYRINELIVVHPTELYCEDNDEFNELLQVFENVLHVHSYHDGHMFGATLKARLKDNFSLDINLSSKTHEEVGAAVAKLNETELMNAIQNGSLQLGENVIALGDVDLFYEFSKELDKNEAFMTKGVFLVVIRMNKELSYYEEGTRLDLISTIRKVRKKANVFPSERIIIRYSTKDECLRSALRKYSSELKACTNTVVEIIDGDVKEDDSFVARESVNVKGAIGDLSLFRT